MMVKLDLGAKLKRSQDMRREVGNVVPENHIPGAEATTVGDRMIPVDQIELSPYQPRLTFDQDGLEALAENIRAVGGLIQPIVIRQISESRFELVAGERRLKAFKLCGYREIPAILRHLSDQEAQKICVTENLQRENLTQFETAKALRRLKEDGVCANNSELARLTGISRSNIILLLHFFDLPEKALKILEMQPGLIGGTTAGDLSAYVKKGHGDLVVQAIERVRDGKTLNIKAADWVESKLASHPVKHERREFANGGRRIATLTRGDKRISLSIDDSALLEQVAELLSKYLQEKSSA